jgi:hypothetical protein
MSCQFRPWRLPGAKVGKTGHDLALGQVSVAHQSLPAVSGQACGISAEQSSAASASIACASSARVPLRKTSVNGSEKAPG